MEDEVQLQSLAKRLINIYNACKWSKTKLHLQKKRNSTRNHRDFEEITEAETESSAPTVFVYNRSNRKKTKDIPDGEATVLRYSEGADRKGRENINKHYCNEQSVNICNCRRCCCDPEKSAPTYEVVDKRKSSDNKKKNSKLVICLKPDNKQEAQAPPKNATRGCCCSAPQNFGTSSPIKKKPSIKPPKPTSTSNRDCLCQCGPPEPDNFLTSIEPPICTSEPFCPYYPPPPPPTRSTIANKAANCQCCPASAPKKKCCECPPSPQNTSCCCQCPPPPPPKPANTCCQCPPSPPSTSGCCQCPPSPPSSSGCCQCPPSPTNISDCCQCAPPPAANFGCQCCPPPCCCDFEELDQEDNSCVCQTENTNNTTVIHAERIIIPTCYFNEGEHSGNLSLAVSEEVKNEMLNDSASDKRKFITSDKNINTSCVVVQSCNSSMRREQSTPVAPIPVPAVIPPRAPSMPHSNRDCHGQPCACRKKDLNDQMINTNSCAVVHSCTSSLKRPKPGAMVGNIPDRKCQGVCCKCQHQASQDQGHHARNHPAPNHQILRYPSDHNFVPSSAASRPPYNGSVYPSGEERMVAKYSPQPFSDQMNPYSGYTAQPTTNQIYPPYDSNYMGAPIPLAPGVPPPRFTDHTALLRSQSTPLCCNLSPKGGGDQRIPGINDDTEAQIYATLQKIEFSLRDEADMHSRNMRCIVDQVCKQAGTIKELKVLVTGVVEGKKAPSCKQVEKKIKKLEKRKEKESRKNMEHDLEERERRKREAKEEGGSFHETSSNPCCKCGQKKKKRSMGCCGRCCAKRCFGCCGRCCKGCCPKCCDKCCYPCEKICPCCCALAKCCDKCWSCSCCPRRKKKCKCSK